MKSFTSILSVALLATSALGYGHGMRRQNVRRQAPPAGKRGLVFNDVGLTKNFNSGQVSWAYNWDSTIPGGTLPAGVTFLPQLWSAAPEHSTQWQANANAAIAKGSTHLLFINEPDLASQSNTSPADAAKQWMQFMQPFAGRATLVSPAITNGAPPAMGTGWMDAFLSECDKLGCTVDAIAAHVYDSATNVAYYKQYITDLGTKYKRPVLITEFGASGSVEQQQAFLKEMVPFMNGLQSVTHFAWFMTAIDNLVTADASLLPLGQTYAAA
ncbi:hypothetical protein C8Q80DRAFT_1219816 [Daedaleopsis nitida]|nr:hypothetical protein C8Q80DRAFT_1219816 [Daedaleopsis nitida]